MADLDGEGLSAFLTKHQLARKNANELWGSALVRAKWQKKRILVHLGAPW